MENVTPTIYGAALRASLELNLPYTPLANTTVNEALAIQEAATISATDVFKVGYVAIGSGGHKITAVGTSYKTERVYHSSSDPCLFKHDPFIMRELINDLTYTEQNDYGLRKVVTYGGVDYAAYYLKKLDLSTVTPVIEYNDPGAGTTVTYAPTSTNLVPVPPTVSTPGTHVISDKNFTITASAVFTMTPDDITEYLNCIDIIYGDRGYGIVSEVAYCSGTERDCTGDSVGGSTITYPEVVAVQPTAFVQVFYAMDFNLSGIKVNLNLGSKEPLFETY